MERFRAVVSVRPECLGAVPKMRPGCAHSSQADFLAFRSSPKNKLAQRLTLIKFNPLGECGLAVRQSLILLVWLSLHTEFTDTALSRCRATARFILEITKLDLHLRYCSLTATPPAFQHIALAATPMPVASSRPLTRLPRQSPGMLRDSFGPVRFAGAARRQVSAAGFSPASHVRGAGCFLP